MLPLLLFHKAFHLLQFLFFCASVNHCFKAIIGAPSTSFNFSVIFYKLHLHCLYCVFHVFASFESTTIIHRWGSSDEAIGSFWDIPKFWVILLGPIKLLGSGFLGLVISGLLMCVKLIYVLSSFHMLF